MTHTYRYLVNPDGSPFDEAKIQWPAGIGTWPPQSTSRILAIVTGGSLIDNGVAAVKAAYPDAEAYSGYGPALKAAYDERHVVLPQIHLGSDEQGRQRKAALERIAASEGHFWGNKPSIGRWLVALADRELENGVA